MVRGRLGVFSKSEKNTPNLIKFIKIYLYSIEKLKENILTIFLMVRGRLEVFSKSKKNIRNLLEFMKICFYSIEKLKENIFTMF